MDVYIDGFPEEMTDVIQELGLTIPNAIAGVKGTYVAADDVVVVVRSNLIRSQGPDMRIRCVIENSHFKSVAVKEEVAKAVYGILTAFCQTHVINSPSNKAKGCVVSVETRTPDLREEGGMCGRIS